MPRHLILLIVLCGATFFAGLGRPAIGDSDEAYYAEASREMIEGGDWLTPHYNYEFRSQKPILFYWLVACSYSIAGVTEAAARLPAALSGLGLALITYGCARRWCGAAAGFLAAAIVATSFGYFALARLSLPDLPLAFFVTLAIWASFIGVDAGRPTVRRCWIVIAAAATGAAFLTKGPVGVVLPAIVLLPAALIEWRLAGRRIDLALADVGLAACVLVLVSAPWYLVMARAHGVSYLYDFFVGENVERFATEKFNAPRPLWFYVPVVAGGMLPWSPFGLLGIGPALQVLRRARRLTLQEWRLIVWVVAPLVFFSLSIGKQPRYVLPILPPAAILLAAAVRARIERHSAPPRVERDWSLSLGGALAGGTLVAFGLLLSRASPLLRAASSAPVRAAVVATILAGVVVTVVALSPRWRLTPGVLIVSAAVTFVALQYTVQSGAEPEPVRVIAARLTDADGARAPFATYRILIRNLVFYTRAKQTHLLSEEELISFLGSPGPVFCVISGRDLAALERAHNLKLRHLQELVYFNTAGLKLRTLLHPDPAEDLDSVVLVRNR